MAKKREYKQTPLFLFECGCMIYIGIKWCSSRYGEFREMVVSDSDLGATLLMLEESDCVSKYYIKGVKKDEVPAFSGVNRDLTKYYEREYNTLTEFYEDMGYNR